MKVYVNNNKITVIEGCTAEKLLETIEMKRRTAIWINGVQILQKDYSLKELKHNDKIKTIRILGGG